MSRSFTPQRGKFTPRNLEIIPALAPCFKPQRGKFTLSVSLRSLRVFRSFKPQRGKFTQLHLLFPDMIPVMFQTPTG